MINYNKLKELMDLVATLNTENYLVFFNLNPHCKMASISVYHHKWTSTSSPNIRIDGYYSENDFGYSIDDVIDKLKSDYTKFKGL